MEEFDLICIGGGSGGLALSTEASKFNKKIAIVEVHNLGGACLQKGCIPKKIMHQTASLLYNIEKQSEHLGIEIDNTSFNWMHMVTTRENYITRVTKNLEARLIRDNIKYFKGFAKFNSDGNIEVHNGGDYFVIKGKHICITSGSEPILLDIIGKEYLSDSNDFFNLQYQPKKVVIIGGGYIGTELTNVLQKLGTKTYLSLKGEYALPYFDEDIKKELLANLIHSGTTIINNSQIDYIKKENNSLTVSFNNSAILIHEVDLVISAVGRVPSISHLNIVLDMTNGKVQVDENYQTSIKHVYAIGDLLNTPNLTPVAIWQGRELARILFQTNYTKRIFPNNIIPSAVFIYPPIGTVGLTELEAIKLYGKDNIQIFETRFTPMFSSITNSPYKSYIKLVCEGVKENVIGIHIIGYNADEIIQGFSVAISKGITRSDLNNAIALHPTLAEEIITLRG